MRADRCIVEGNPSLGRARPSRRGLSAVARLICAKEGPMPYERLCPSHGAPMTALRNVEMLGGPTLVPLYPQCASEWNERDRARLVGRSSRG